MKVYQDVGRALAAHGTEVVFGVMGETNMHVVDSLVHDHGVQYVKAAREDGAVLMAYGYAARSGDLGVASVTRGPGLTNTVTALTEAARQGVPLLLVVGDSGPDEPWGRQNLDQARLVAATGAQFQRVTSGGAAGEEIRRAIRRAVQENRPVVLSVPIDVQAMETAQEPRPVEIADPQPLPDASAEELDVAIGIIASSRRPVVLAGRGAVRSDARQTLLRLADRIGAPVATTIGAKDLFRGEPFDLGVCGTVASPIGGRVLSEADCLIVFGASLNHDTTAGGAFTNGKRIVQVDSRADSIGRRTPVASGVVGDAGPVAATMVTWLDRLGSPSPNWCRHLVGELAASAPGDGIVDYGTDDTVDARLFTIRLNELLPKERTVVTDAGRFMIAPLAWLQVTEPDAFILPCAFGSIGLGLGVGIGAAFATPGRPVVVTAGDGGAMMSMLELATAVRHRLNLIYVIYNNRAYGAEIRATEAEGLDPKLALIEWPELLPLARSLGCAGVRVRQPGDLEHLAEAIAGEARPLVVDVMLDPFAPAGP